MFKNSVEIGPGVKGFIGIAIALSLLSANPLLSVIALLVPPVLARLTWRKNEPPIMFIGLMIQWFQVCVKVFYANYLNVPFIEIHQFPEHIEFSFYLGLLTLVVQGLGFAWATKDWDLEVNKSEEYANNFSLRILTLTYVAAIFIAPIIEFLPLGGLQQFSVKVAEMKWSLFFLLYFVTIKQNKNIQNFYLIFAFEVVLAFTGYFSSFKDFFIIFSIAYFTINQKIKAKQYAFLTTGAIILFNFFVIWQFIKSDYRTFLTGGRLLQSSTVGTGEALNHFYTLASGMDKEDFSAGIQAVVDRLSYIDYLSASQTQVPAIVPHENGRIWLEAVTRVFMPRFLFPNKAIIDDSAVARKYTGAELAGLEQGTSISLGYAAESYVDFGHVFMFVPLFLFGLLVGRIYKYILTTSKNLLWGYAFVIPVFFQLFRFEAVISKIMGGLIAYFLVLLIVRKFAFKNIESFLTKNSK